MRPPVAEHPPDTWAVTNAFIHKTSFARFTLRVLLILVLSLAPFLYGCVEPWSQVLLTGALGLLALAWVLISKTLPWPPLAAWATGAMALLAVLQTRAVLGPWDPGPSLRTASLSGSLSAARLWLAWALLLWMGGVILGSQSSRRWALYGILAAVAIFAGLGIVLRSQAAPALFHRALARSTTSFGPYVNNNQAAALMAMTFCLGAGLWVDRVLRFKAWHSLGEQANFWSGQILIGAVLCLLSAGVVATGSRGAPHAWSLASLLVMALGGRRLQDRWRLRYAVVLMGAVGFYLALAPHIKLSLSLSGQGWDASTRERLAIWQESLVLFRDRPWLGSGLGAFGPAFSGYQPLSLRGKVEHAHSEWLEILCGGGLLGGGLTGLALLGPWLQALRLWWRGNSFEAPGLQAGLLAAAGGFFIHGLVDFPLQMPATAGLFFFLLSCLAWPSLKTTGRHAVASWLCVPAVGILLFLSHGPLLAWAHIRRAEKISLAEKAALLETATRWDPSDTSTRRRLGAIYLTMAQETPARRIFMEKAYRQADACLAAAPFDAGCLEMAGHALQGLNRPADGEARLRQAGLLRPWRRP